jgi:hypothetical protein
MHNIKSDNRAGVFTNTACLEYAAELRNKEIAHYVPEEG